MKIKKWQIMLAVVIILGGWGIWKKTKKSSDGQGPVKIIQARRGLIRSTISTTATVLPKNRLEIKPPVSGRVEQLLVKEGDHVKQGDVIAWMSSTDRAALLDAARGQGQDKFKYWQDVYKPIPLIAPIAGDVIVGTTQPGQAVTTADAVFVLSDQLIVRAQVDETDVGKIREGQKAIVSLDAYPDVKIHAAIDHIYHESKTVNNVTIYEADLQLENIPAFFRSGMNANVDFIVEEKNDALLLPASAVIQDKGKAYVLLESGKGNKPAEHEVVLGISDDKNVEIVSGLTELDEVILKSRKFNLADDAPGSNPFMPQRRKRQN